MLSAHWEEVKSVFEAALLLEEGEREAFVSSRCGEDHELAQGVHSLLAADRESSKFLEEALLRRAAVYLPDGVWASRQGRHLLRPIQSARVPWRGRYGTSLQGSGSRT